jgi:uncharacterized protein YndB with AHSA1/START domain
MIRTDTNVLINRPVEEVWNYVINNEYVPKWALGFKELRYITEGPMHMGTRSAWTQTFLGKDISSTVETTEFEPYKYITFKSITGPFSFMYRYIFESTPSGTKFTVYLEGEPGGFFKLAEPLLTTMVKRQLQNSFENLKDLIESEALVPA